VAAGRLAPVTVRAVPVRAPTAGGRGPGSGAGSGAGAARRRSSRRGTRRRTRRRRTAAVSSARVPSASATEGTRPRGCAVVVGNARVAPASPAGSAASAPGGGVAAGGRSGATGRGATGSGVDRRDAVGGDRGGVPLRDGGDPTRDRGLRVVGGEAPQRGRQLRAVAGPLAGVHPRGPVDHLDESGRCPVGELTERRQRRGQPACGDLDGVALTERCPAAQRLVHDQPEGVDVGAGVDRVRRGAVRGRGSGPSRGPSRCG
jgi:hypothetical protein